jgi:hypothetical protein
MATIELKVKTLDSRVLTLQVQGTQTILDVKQLVFTETQVPVEQQRLIFRGKVLKDALALSEYPGLLDGGSTIHMVQRQGPGPSDSNQAGGGSASQSQSQNHPTDQNRQFPPQMQVPFYGIAEEPFLFDFTKFRRNNSFLQNYLSFVQHR